MTQPPNTLNHVALLCRSAEETAAALARLKLPIGPTETFPEGTKEIYIGDLAKEKALLLLMEPIAPGSYRRALEKRGPGLHHLAIDIENRDDFLQSVSGTGWMVLPHSIQRPTLWLAAKGFPGLLEVDQRSDFRSRERAFVEEVLIPAPAPLLAALNVPEIKPSPSQETTLRLRNGHSLQLGPLLDPAAHCPQPRLESARLALEPYTASDLPDIFAYAKQPEVSQFLVWNPHQSLSDAERFFRWLQAQTSTKRGKVFFVFAIRSKESGRVIGSIDFKQISAWCGQLDYVLGKEHWGKGYMTEAGKLLRDWALKEFPEMKRLQSFCLPDNKASSRVMQKLGMEFEGVRKRDFKNKGELVDVAHYALVR